jgi:hypothetical protein
LILAALPPERSAPVGLPSLSLFDSNASQAEGLYFPEAAVWYEDMSNAPVSPEAIKGGYRRSS